jgi:hypothetical protein
VYGKKWAPVSRHCNFLSHAHSFAFRRARAHLGAGVRFPGLFGRRAALQGGLRRGLQRGFESLHGGRDVAGLKARHSFGEERVKPKRQRLQGGGGGGG